MSPARPQSISVPHSTSEGDSFPKAPDGTNSPLPNPVPTFPRRPLPKTLHGPHPVLPPQHLHFSSSLSFPCAPLQSRTVPLTPPGPLAAPPALLSLRSQGTGALRRGPRGRPCHKAGETPRCSPTRDRVAGEGGGGDSFAREAPSLLLPAPSPPPRTRVAGATRLCGLGAAPTGRPDICNQHGGSGEGRAARPGGK